MNSHVTFSPEIYAKVSETTRLTMKYCENGAASLWLTLDQMTEHFSLSSKGDIRDVHNNHLRAILASTSAKHVSLSISLIEAVNKYDFLTYALTARALVEIVAAFRYMMLQKMGPIIHDMSVAGQYRSSHVKALIKEEDVYLRGTQFDWIEFFEEGFRPLNDRYAEWLAEKKKDKQAKKWKRGRAAPIEQVNVSTCLEKWAHDQPGVGVLYDLLCDMVHPNIGSLMSTTVPEAEGMRFRVRDASSEGFKLFQYSFPAFMTLTGHEYSRLIEMLMLSFLPTNEKAASAQSRACQDNGIPKD